MVLGVSSVIAMLAIGEGSKREAVERIRQLGAANVIIRSIKPGATKTTKRGVQSAGQQQSSRVLESGCSTATANCLKATLLTVEKVVPIALIRRNAQHGRFRVANARVLGVTPAIPGDQAARRPPRPLPDASRPPRPRPTWLSWERGPRNACSAMKIPSENRCSWGRVRIA